jgi:hypothetical protein
MTPKEKAKELVDNYLEIDACINFEDAKLCALIAVDEILKAIEVIPNVRYRYVEEGIWLEVKTEIQAL